MSRPDLVSPDLMSEESMNVPRRRGMVIMLWIIVLLLSVTLVTITGFILQRPDVFGLESASDVTATAAGFRGTQQALEATAQGLSISSGELALESNAVISTQLALEDREIVVAQRETQSAAAIQATETAVSVRNAVQATQAAVDFEMTQSAFSRFATQVELDYRGTEAALNRDATAIALGFATEEPPGEDTLPQSPSPTITDIPLFTDGFSGGISGALWEVGQVQDWGVGDGGVLTAQRTGAWLVTRTNAPTTYRLEVDLNLLQGVVADYFVVMNLPQNETETTVVLRLSSDGQEITAAGLFRATPQQVFGSNGLFDENLEAIHGVQIASLPLEEALSVRLALAGEEITVVLNNIPVLDFSLDSVLRPGPIGVQMPENTGIRRIALYP